MQKRLIFRSIVEPFTSTLENRNLLPSRYLRYPLPLTATTVRLIKRFTYRCPKMHTSSPVAFKASEASVVKNKIVKALSRSFRRYPPSIFPSLVPLSGNQNPNRCGALQQLATLVRSGEHNLARPFGNSGQTFNQSELEVCCFASLCIKSGRESRCQYHLYMLGNSHFSKSM